jgi:A nuclease family of the HNH/ENDO VII superfamily with conserved AHH
MIHEFRLSPLGKGGISCDQGGAFVGAVPMLVRTHKHGRDEWRPRDCDVLSKEMSAQYGLPVDMSSKTGGLRAIANAFNDGDMARAQVATLLLRMPNPPSLSKGAPSRQEMIKLAGELHWSGVLKADWDPDQHPRWPAHAPDSQGGRFAPKGDDPAAGQSAGATSQAKQPSAHARHAGSSASRQRGSGASANNQSVPPGNDQGDDNKRNVSDAEDRGIYASYGHYIGGKRLADAAFPMDGFPISVANPADWADLKWLAEGAFKLGSGQIITAAMLLAAVEPHFEKADVNDAISKFEFDPTNAADVLAARAYVWADHWAPWNYPVPWSGPQHEAVSQSIMAVELARPGTLYLASQGDRESSRYIDAAVADGMQDGLISESRARPANLPAALQTTIASARAALDLKTNDGMRAHHLIAANVWAKFLNLATLAIQAGWQPDSGENLIALPADAGTQARGGFRLPIHNSSHRVYDEATRGAILIEEAKCGTATPTPAQARTIFENAAKVMEGQIRTGRWMPRLH